MNKNYLIILTTFMACTSQGMSSQECRLAQVDSAIRAHVQAIYTGVQDDVEKHWNDTILFEGAVEGKINKRFDLCAEHKDVNAAQLKLIKENYRKLYSKSVNLRPYPSYAIERFDCSQDGSQIALLERRISGKVSKENVVLSVWRDVRYQWEKSLARAFIKPIKYMRWIKNDSKLLIVFESLAVDCYEFTAFDKETLCEMPVTAEYAWKEVDAEFKATKIDAQHIKNGDAVSLVRSDKLIMAHQSGICVGYPGPIPSIKDIAKYICNEAAKKYSSAQ